MSLEKETRNTAKSVIGRLMEFRNILAVLAIFVPILLYWYSESKKELTFSIEQTISLIEADKLKENDLKVLFKDSVLVNNIIRVDCRITNTGNQPIMEKDYVDGIEIGILETPLLFRYKLVSNPSDAKIQFKEKTNSLNVVPDLLNPTDFIFISIYYTIDTSDVTPKGKARIAGGSFYTQSKLEASNGNGKFFLQLGKTTETFLIWLCLLYNIGFGILIFWASFINEKKESIAFRIFLFLLLGSGAIITSVYFLATEILK